MKATVRVINVLIAFFMAASMVLTGVVVQPVQAGAANIRISQVYGGGGNSGAIYNRDYVELFNPTDVDVDLTGWSIVYASATGTTWTYNDLSGQIKAHSYYLLGLASGSVGSNLPAVDASRPQNLSGTNGKVVLVNRKTPLLTGSCPTGDPIIDFVGYGGTANCYEVSPTETLSNATAAIRKNAGCTDADNNSTDFEVAAPTPRNSSSATHACDADSAPYVTGVTPPNNTSGVALDVVPTATFSEAVTTSTDWVTMTCTQTAPITLTPTTTDDTTFTLTPAPTLQIGDSCTMTVDATKIFDRDGTPTAMETDYSWSFSTSSCGEPYTAIHDIQGSGGSSPLVGTDQTVEGVVTAEFQGLSGGWGGYFIQDPNPDANAATSEGIYVYDTQNQVAAGDQIRLTARVTEYTSTGYGNMAYLTELGSLTRFESCGSGAVITPTELDLPTASDPTTYLEAYEGMLVTFPEMLTVQQNYFLGRFGQVTLGAAGRIFQPTNSDPGSTGNIERMLVLDDAYYYQNLNPVSYYPVDDTFRAGDTVSGLTGVISQNRINSTNSGDIFPNTFYTLYPTSVPTFDKVNLRPTTPPAVGGTIQVASFNVLNYFTTFGSRGANNQAEFNRQRAKIINAIVTLDADVVGLMEIENNGEVAISDLVAGLNAATAPGTYAYIPDPSFIGADEIKVALIYQPASVTPIGTALSSTMDIFSRPPVAQMFQDNISRQRFWVIVNHFKSKSCDGAIGADLDQGDGQGCFNNLRKIQATTLLEYIGELTSTYSNDLVLVIGDLNSYGAEDPIDSLTDGGLINEVATRIPADQQYSYIFDGQSGYLDHALASPNLDSAITGVSFWHINADEPSVIDYNTEYNPPSYYSPSIYRASDHDPVVVGLNFRRIGLFSDDLETDFVKEISQEFHIKIRNPSDSVTYDHAKLKFSFDDTTPEDISQFQYWDAGENMFVDIPLSDNGYDSLDGAYGPETGFPITSPHDEEITFRITFTQAGIYNVMAWLTDLDNEYSTIASMVGSPEVKDVVYAPPVFSADMGSGYIAGERKEFSVTASNPLNGENFETVGFNLRFHDLELTDVTQLQYYDPGSSTWAGMEIQPDGFGNLVSYYNPPSDLPLLADTIQTGQFRITFANSGTYDYTFELVNLNGFETLQSITGTIVVNEANYPIFLPLILR